jgi:hypothetical protein|tara:strand:+ start:1065 stop:1253 length:189 start_codon:yes stop_codon:yes gene_type:complete
MARTILEDLKKTQRKQQLDFQAELTKEELKYLLNLIANSEFKGVDLQTIYSITAKVQNKLLN